MDVVGSFIQTICDERATHSLIAGLSGLAVLVFGLGLARADYQPMNLHKTISEAELIVLGTISEVRDKTFVVKEAELIDGDGQTSPLEVRKVAEWPGNARWTSYGASQRVLLLLVAQKGEHAGANKPWKIVGFGGEGEFPVQDGFAYVRGPVLEGFEIGEYVVAGAALRAYRFDLETFLSAIEGHRRCFTLVDSEEKGRSDRFKRVCDDAQLADYRSQSALHGYLVDASLKDLAGKED